MLKPLIASGMLLWSLCLCAQSDSTQDEANEGTQQLIYNPYNREIQISISEALYDYPYIDDGFALRGGVPSIGVSFQKEIAGKLKGQVSGYFSERRYKYQRPDSTIQTSGPPVLEKDFSVVDLIGLLVYDFQECTGVKAYITAGIGGGILVKGRCQIKGLEEAQYSENPSPLFSSTVILLYGGGMKYYFTEHFGLDLKFLWHRNIHSVVRGEDKVHEQLRFELGICYAF